MSKEIMKRTKLGNNFLNNRMQENRKKYAKQRKLCVPSIRKIKQNYLNSFNEKNINDNMKFWRTLKLFKNVLHTNEKIISVKNENILSNDNEIAEVLNYFFSNIMKTSWIPQKCSLWFVYRWHCWCQTEGYC